MPTLANTHIDKAISNLLISQMQDESVFISNKVLPITFVERSSDKYYKDDDSHFEISDLEYSSSGGSNEIDFDFSTDSYQIKEFGGKHPIPDSLMRDADEPIKRVYRTAAAKKILQKLLRGKEQNASDLLFNTTTFSGKYETLTGTSQWSDDTSNPFKKIATACENVLLASGKEPNTIIMGYQVWNYLRNHPEALKRIPDNSAKVLTNAMFKEFLKDEGLNIDQVLIGKAVKEASGTRSFIWGKHCLIANIDQSANTLMDTTLGKTFMFNGLAGLKTEYYRDPDPDKERELVRVRYNWGHEVTDVNNGYLYYNAVA